MRERAGAADVWEMSPQLLSAGSTNVQMSNVHGESDDDDDDVEGGERRIFSVIHGTLVICLSSFSKISVLSHLFFFCDMTRVCSYFSPFSLCVLFKCYFLSLSSFMPLILCSPIQCFYS